MANVFGHEIHICIPKFGQNSHFYSQIYRGGGGSTGLGNIPKKNNFFECFPKECMLSSSSCSTLNTWKVDTRSWYFERIHLINDILDIYLDIWICIRYTISRYKTLTVIWLKSVCWAHHAAPPWTLSQQINQFLNQTLWPSSSSLGGIDNEKKY